MESIQIVRARSSLRASTSATSAGAEPVVITTPGRSRSRMRISCAATTRKAHFCFREASRIV